MGDHLEIFTTRVWDVGVSRLMGHAVRSIHEKPRGSGDVDGVDPMLSMVAEGILITVNNSH